MTRTILGKSIWVGRAAVFLVGLAMILALALTARSAGAEPCADCDPGGGGGGGNVAPTVGANSGSVTVPEGRTANNSGTYSDPDGNSTVTLSASVGTVTKDAAGSGTWSWSFATSDGPDQSRTVTITATDDQNVSKTTTFSLSVNNAAPTTTITAGPATVQEGTGWGHVSGHWVTSTQTSVLYSYSASDPGADAVNTHANCGVHGSLVSGPDGTSFRCAFGDGPSITTVSASSTDSDGATGNTATRSVTITNVNPQATLEAPGSVDEDSPATVSLINPLDPSMDDFNAGFRYAFDCNGGSLAGATYANGSTSATATCSYNDSGTKTVRARIIDQDGGFSEYTRTITANDITQPLVTGVAPTGKGVARNTSLTANFSERMNPDTLGKSTIKLFKVDSDGTTTRILNTTVTPNTDGLAATLDPFGTSTTLLRANTKYKAIITTGAEDLAGNALDQNSSSTGNQPKVWTFTTGGS